MHLQEAFSYLKKTLGTDRACADFLGYTQNHFNALIRGRKHISEKTAIFIIDKTQRLKKKRGD